MTKLDIWLFSFLFSGRDYICPLCFDRSLKVYPNIRISHNSSESLCRRCATGSASPASFSNGGASKRPACVDKTAIWIFSTATARIGSTLFFVAICRNFPLKGPYQDKLPFISGALVDGICQLQDYLLFICQPSAQPIKQ